MAHILLKDIIDTIMEYSEDPDNYLNGVSRSLVISRAKRLLQEVNYAGLKNLSLFESEISASGKVVLPEDCVEYVKVYYCVGNYLLPAFLNDNINTLQWDSLKETEEVFITSETGKKILTESNDYITVDVKSDEKVKEYGHVKNMCFLKGYKEDWKNNCLVFDYIPCGITHVAVLYVSDPLVEEPDISKLGIHKYFQKALEAGIYSYIIEQRRNVPMNEKIRAKREWLIKYKDAVSELNAKPYELLQVLSGWKHMRKQCYPGMGGQTIPQKKEEKYLYSLEYVDFVCQLSSDEKEKETDNIVFSTDSSTTEVIVNIEAEKEVNSDVELRFSAISSARSVQPQDICYVLKKGKKSGSFVINSGFYGKNTDASILSVDNVVNSKEDDVYIYNVENDVFVQDLKDKNRIPIHVSASIEDGNVKITFTGDVASKVVLEITSDTDPSYTRMVILSAANKTLTDTFRSEFAGHDASIQIYSVNGNVGEVSDDYNIYEVPESISIPDISEKPTNLITVESRLEVWLAKWKATSQYPVASNIGVSLSIPSNPGMAPQSLQILKGKTEPSEYGGFFTPMIGEDCDVSLSTYEDDTYKYEAGNRTHHFADTSILDGNDWSVSFYVGDDGGIYPVISFEKPLTSDVEFCFSTNDSGYVTAISLINIRKGEMAGKDTLHPMNYFEKEDVRFFIRSVGGVGEYSFDIEKSWDLSQVFTHFKMVEIPSIVAEFTTTNKKLEHFFLNNTNCIVSYGDGVVRYIRNGNGFDHTYTDDAESHKVVVLGFDGIRSITCYSCGITSLKVYGLSDIYCPDNTELTSLEIVNGEYLNKLSCGRCNMSNLDVSDFKMLTNLYCEGNPLTQLDLSENAELIELGAGGTQIASLDVSNCINISSISLYTNPPFVENPAALIGFASSLPDRTGKDTGVLNLTNDIAKELIQAICGAKNWTIE